MTPNPEYRFRFAIVDQTTGDVIESDCCYIADIDQHGNCPSVDIHIGTMLRNWRNFARAEYEAKNAPEIEDEAA